MKGQEEGGKGEETSLFMFRVCVCENGTGFVSKSMIYNWKEEEEKSINCSVRHKRDDETKKAKDFLAVAGDRTIHLEKKKKNLFVSR